MRQVPCRSLVLFGRLRSPSHVVCQETLDLPSVDAQSLLPPGDDATFVSLYPTLVLVTLATVFACPQLVKNCPSTQLMTHEVSELSEKLRVIGPELDDDSSGIPSTTSATNFASALRAPSAVV